LSDDVAIRTVSLVKTYGGRRALDGLSLEVPSGVVYGFLGPNGAGKTTTMRILTGLARPDSGHVELMGKPFSWRDRRRLFHVGALIESPMFYPYLSGRGNLRVLAGTGAAPPANRIEEVLEFVGLRDRGDDRFSAYSLGMKQRLGIAAALLNDPDLLLLDEPANGLDPAGIVAIREMLRGLAATGKTVFVSSHILSEIQMMADQVAIIANGRLVRAGRLEDLLAASGEVRARVQPESLRRAVSALGTTFGPAQVDGDGRDPGWLLVRTSPSNVAAVNRELVGAGIDVLGLEAGNDLERLFLSLTEDRA
jgi:ABC-2 type transport system ATP-binding protein